MHLEEDVVQGSLQKTEPALFEVQLFICDWTVGRVGAWGYELTYQDRKKQDMGLLTDCERNPERPAITAAYQAITSLKRKCRVGIKMDGCPCLCAALEFGLDEVPEFEGVPEWSKLLEALSTHSYYLDSVWYNNPWSPDPWSLEHPLVTKVKQRAKAYLDTLT